MGIDTKKEDTVDTGSTVGDSMGISIPIDVPPEMGLQQGFTLTWVWINPG
jgi:hypothetical protein